MEHQHRDYERHLISLLGFILLGLSVWSINKLTDTGELVAAQNGSISNLQGEVERLENRVDSRYSATHAQSELASIDRRLSSIETRIIRLENKLGGFEQWQESQAR